MFHALEPQNKTGKDIYKGFTLDRWIVTKEDLKKVYSLYIPYIRKTAFMCGYAVAIHGSETKDLDLIAVPWIEKAKRHNELVQNICNTVYGFVTVPPVIREHNRIVYTVSLFEVACKNINGGYIDLSVMPTNNS